MAEKVLVASVRSPSRTVLMDARVARQLVARGRFTYADKQLTAESEPAAKKAAKKRGYKRRDMKAED